MKSRTGLFVILGIVVLLFFWGCSAYNNLIGVDQDAVKTNGVMLKPTTKEGQIFIIVLLKQLKDLPILKKHFNRSNPGKCKSNFNKCRYQLTPPTLRIPNCTGGFAKFF